MSLLHRPTANYHNLNVDDVFNIVPVHDHLADHPSLRFPEIRAAMFGLRTVGELRRPPSVPWSENMDILDWLGSFFGFQRDNVRNQREHIVLLLANAQMRLQPPPDNIDCLDTGVVRRLRRKVLSNYTSWCDYLGQNSNVWVSENNHGGGSGGSLNNPRRDLLYTALYLLIWGEAANLRFVPECLAYIFHNMALDLNRILENCVDDATGALSLPAYTGNDAFLHHVVTPIYQTIKAEVDASRNGTAPHSTWRNYDDINEYFWCRDVFDRLGWPLDLSKGFFSHPPDNKRVRKTGFVEQRSFWNLFRSFDRLWIMLIIFLQAAIVIAWEEGSTFPWQSLQIRDVQVSVLSVFVTWAALRFLKTILDAATQHSLISRETPLVGLRMLLKSMVSAGWTIVFCALYARIWEKKKIDRGWSAGANGRVLTFVEVAGVFVVPEAVGLLLFVLPFFGNFLEKSNWKILFVLTWWFQSRMFIGRGLREGVIDNMRYSVFWVAVLSAKFSFSYLLQIKPMIGPTKSLLDIKIGSIDHQWHEFFRDTITNRLAVLILWLPVILIYLMDISIWYSIFSSIVGALVGLFSHLGEIRNVQQLRLRFQFFASALQFNLMPVEERLYRSGGTLRSRFHDGVLRLKLRYGLGNPYSKIESNQVGVNRFGLIWNQIIVSFREEDIISDREVELLELPSNAWNISVIRWPCFLLCNELLLALRQAKELVLSDKRHWRKIRKNEYRRCAVIEAYDSIKFLLGVILKKNSQEHSIICNLFSSYDDAINNQNFTVKFRTSTIPILHSKLILLLDLLLLRRRRSEVVNALQNLYDVAVRDFPRKTEIFANDGLIFVNAVELPRRDSDTFFHRQVRRLHTIMTSRDSMNDIPKNLEARRRIAFFSNSVFMNIPRAPQVEKMLGFSVLTPYYSEEVMYSKEQLCTQNEDGVSILFYLQKIYPDEWAHFVERMRREGGMRSSGDDFDIWGERLPDVRLWASFRGQTLTRTVRGMMYYHKALKMLAFLDSASEVEISCSEVDMHREHGDALIKYTYVVACQIYGAQKGNKDPRAEEILYLMKNNEALRVAYVDQVAVSEDGDAERMEQYYSVLVKYDRGLQKEVEIYRIRLPGPLKLGEGKPENQNHAIIFTRGDAVQTIDMNQDNYLEEALKMRNLLEELTHRHGSRKPSILGVGENVFTGSVSSLASFMSAQEMSFVTLGQRVLANPLKVRMHYGHPDVFDRLWFLSRGGVSKASKVINISEDIFAGFNCTLRGGNVTHHEYMRVGKGRDVGLNQISMFEAKVGSGNGEQLLSRDVYRLGQRLDFFRMLSFYHTTVGFFFNTMIVVLTVYASVWGRVYLALSGTEEAITNSGAVANNAALGSVLNQQFAIQLGLFTALPMIVENSLEHGFLSAVWDFITMQLQLASVFYAFSMGTRTHYFGRTVLHGGAKYRATGRGFVVQHKSFAENYRLYARSHFIKAIELGLALTIYASYSSPAAAAKDSLVYMLINISTCFLVASWIMAPFVFNPSGFDWLKTVYDFEEFMNWMWCSAHVFAKADQSWEIWWYEEQDHLRTTSSGAKLFEIILDLRFFFFQYGIVYHLKIANGSTSIAVYLLSWTYVLVALGIFVAMNYAGEKYGANQHIYYRSVQSLVILAAFLLITLLLRVTSFQMMDIFTSLLAFIPTGWGLVLIAQVIGPSTVGSGVVWDTVVSVARLYDILLGVIVMAPVALLAWLPGFQSMQTRILFNEAFSRGLHISRIIAGNKTL